MRRNGSERVTGNEGGTSQLCYFTSSSLLEDGRTLIFIREQEGQPNLFAADLVSGEERQLTQNCEGILKSYVYFDGRAYTGFGKASVSVDTKRGMIYYIQGSDLCCVDHWGKQRRLARLPRGQVTAFTHVSADGTKICVPTTDAAALECREGEYFVDNKPNYDIDERVRREHLHSYLRVYDTVTGRIIFRCAQKGTEEAEKTGLAMRCGSRTVILSSTTASIKMGFLMSEG